MAVNTILTSTVRTGQRGNAPEEQEVLNLQALQLWLIDKIWKTRCIDAPNICNFLKKEV
jgi:hypothetical protein